jgi:hypothetical protein
MPEPRNDKTNLARTTRGLDTETVKGFARLCAVEGLGCFDVDSWRDVETVFDAVARSGSKWIVAYNIDYDVTALCKWLPYRKKALMFRGINIEHGRTTLQYRPNKSLRVNLSGKRFVLYDCFQYYGTSLDAASKKHLGVGKMAFDVKRLTLRRLRTADARRYCLDDAEKAGKLFRLFLGRLPAELVGVTPVSPGFLARRAFRETLDANGVPWSVNNLWRRAFRGGRFECFRRGMFRDVYVYDIRSAYPTEIANLCSLAGGRFRLAHEADPEAVYRAYSVDLHVDDKWTGPVQVSTRSGLSVCPVGRFGPVWVTDAEFDVCNRRGYVSGVRSVCNVYGSTDRPFAEKVAEYYERKQGPDGYAYKKLLNSIYGKTCQTVGRFIRPTRSQSGALECARNQWGEYLYRIEDTRGANFTIAATVTANVRMRLYDVIDRNRDCVVACFTDSIVSTRPIPELVLSECMGDWELKRIDWLYLIGSGIYFYGYEGKTVGRMRGIPLTDAAGLFARIRMTPGDRVSLSSKHRYSFRAACGDDVLENMILDVIRYLDLNFDRKRHWAADFRSGRDNGPHESSAICYM